MTAMAVKPKTRDLFASAILLKGRAHSRLVTGSSAAVYDSVVRSVRGFRKLQQIAANRLANRRPCRVRQPENPFGAQAALNRVFLGSATTSNPDAQNQVLARGRQPGFLGSARVGRLPPSSPLLRCPNFQYATVYANRCPWKLE